MVARTECWESIATWASLSAKHVLAAHHETPPPKVLPLYFFAFLLLWWSLRKNEWRRERECATSAIVANALLWIRFPLFRWKIKVLPWEALRICDLWLVLQRFFQQSLIMKGENQVVQTDPEGLRGQMSDCCWFIARVLCFVHLCLDHFLKPPFICIRNQHHMDRDITGLRLPKAFCTLVLPLPS